MFYRQISGRKRLLRQLLHQDTLEGMKNKDNVVNQRYAHWVGTSGETRMSKADMKCRRKDDVCSKEIQSGKNNSQEKQQLRMVNT